MKIRPARSTDLPGLKSLAERAWAFTYAAIYSRDYIVDFVDRVYTQSFHDMLLDRVSAGLHQMDLLVDDQGIEGIADVDRDDQGAHLMRLYLSPALIGQGWGSALLQQAELRVRQFGLDAYDLVVHRENRLGVEFYRRRGFLRCEVLDDEAEGDWGFRKTLVPPL